MATTTSLIAGSKFSARDFREAKRAWSERLLLSPQAAPVALGAARRAGAHAMAAAVRATPARRNDNVVGVGIAEKWVKGKPTGVLAVKFFVKSKFPTGAVARGLVLPKTIDGLPVDVEETGTLRAFAKRSKRAKAADDTIPNPRMRMRPAHAGCSVGFRIPGDQFLMCGTFGAMVKTARKVFILSNNHVLANENALPLNSPIFQPGLLDGGVAPGDRIAKLSKFIKIKKLPANNKVDAAIAALDKPSLASPLILPKVGKLGSTAPVAALMDMKVHKHGRTTGYTRGRVIDVSGDFNISYDFGTARFVDQIVIVGDSGSFSNSGDSGSLIVERSSNQATGLLFAGSTSHTIANHISDVLSALGVTLVI